MLGSETCRDFALLMMEAARSFGLAARFVTGHLEDQGAHAWCAAYLPGAGCVEYDPTNGFLAGDNLIRPGAAHAQSQALRMAGGDMDGHATHCGPASRLRNGG